MRFDTCKSCRRLAELCGGKNAHSEPLLASYILCSCQNALSKAIQASYMLCGSQNAHSETLQASYTHCSGQNKLFNACKRLADVRSARFDHSKLSNCLAEFQRVHFDNHKACRYSVGGCVLSNVKQVGG